MIFCFSFLSFFGDLRSIVSESCFVWFLGRGGFVFLWYCSFFLSVELISSLSLSPSLTYTESSDSGNQWQISMLTYCLVSNNKAIKGRWGKGRCWIVSTKEGDDDVTRQFCSVPSTRHFRFLFCSTKSRQQWAMMNHSFSDTHKNLSRGEEHAVDNYCS